LKDETDLRAPDWRQYPIHAELLTNRERFQALRDRCLRTCAALDAVLRTGPTEQRQLAQSVLNAYGYALALLDDAIRARDEVLQNDTP
jgi:hypothetical protein